MADTATWIRTVRSSHDRFAGLLRPLTQAEVVGPSYAAEWSIADTASHLGSQAEIFGLFLDAGLAGRPAPGGEVFPPIWERWNALPPIEQVRQSVDVNEAFVSRVEQTPDEQRDRFSLAAFGTDLDLGGLMAMRLGELALHTWDIAVALDATATVSADAVDLLIDQLPVTAARTGKASTGAKPVGLVTTDPARTFVLDVGDAVTLQPSPEPGADPLLLPAEGLVRLVYGRLDADHTPAGVDEARLADLRPVFPGF
ncbi:MAG: maleylpyruvate isomerase family mycothiol-dependent enzyme [Janthinobacterium lividum]